MDSIIEFRLCEEVVLRQRCLGMGISLPAVLSARRSFRYGHL